MDALLSLDNYEESIKQFFINRYGNNMWSDRVLNLLDVAAEVACPQLQAGESISGELLVDCARLDDIIAFCQQQEAEASVKARQYLYQLPGYYMHDLEIPSESRREHAYVWVVLHDALINRSLLDG
ncbi:MAG: hypothetical protein RSG77_25705 [Hafnia sp.]